jgi:hypothetical protein
MTSNPVAIPLMVMSYTGLKSEVKFVQCGMREMLAPVSIIKGIISGVNAIRASEYKASNAVRWSNCSLSGICTRVSIS